MTLYVFNLWITVLTCEILDYLTCLTLVYNLEIHGVVIVNFWRLTRSYLSTLTEFFEVIINHYDKRALKEKYISLDGRHHYSFQGGKCFFRKKNKK